MLSRPAKHAVSLLIIHVFAFSALMHARIHVDTAITDGLYELVAEPRAEPSRSVAVAEFTPEDPNRSSEELKAVVEQEGKHHNMIPYVPKLCKFFTYVCAFTFWNMFETLVCMILGSLSQSLVCVGR